MDKLTIEAPAKVNLFLEILNKRKDGYHNIQSVMQTIDLKDIITIKKKEGKIKILSNHPTIPKSSRNLCFKAAALLLKEMKIKKSVEITIEKKIPLNAGLGGGSSDAAATLKGLNTLFKLNLSILELQKIGKKIGADVPFFICGGTAKVEGKGEIITPLPKLPPYWFILIKPEVGVLTKKIYKCLDDGNLKLKDKKNIKHIIAGIKNKDFALVGKNLYNRLEKISIIKYPVIGKVKEMMKKRGFEYVLMSGSGSVVFGLVKEKRKAEELYKNLVNQFKYVFIAKRI